MIVHDENKAMNQDEEDDHQETQAQWSEIKRYRNRINSQRTRERERFQLETLESEKSRLFLSNDALRYQNGHLREAIKKIREQLILQVTSMTPSTSDQTAPGPHLSLSSSLLQPLVAESVGVPQQIPPSEQASAVSRSLLSSLLQPLANDPVGASSGLNQIAGVAHHHQSHHLANLLLANDSAASVGVLGSHNHHHHHHPSAAALGLAELRRQALGGAVTASGLNQADLVRQLMLNSVPSVGTPSIAAELAARRQLLNPLPDTLFIGTPGTTTATTNNSVVAAPTAGGGDERQDDEDR